MVKAKKLRGIRAVRNAIVPTLETLEQRQLLAAGQLDWSFGQGTGLVIDQQPESYNNNNLLIPVYNPGNVASFGVPVPTAAQQVNIVHDVTVDANGKIIVVGEVLGHHYYQIPNTQAPTQVYDRDFYLARYKSDGTIDYYIGTNGGNAPGFRDVMTNTGGAYPATSQTSTILNDFARAVTVDPADGTIVVVGTNRQSGIDNNGVHCQLVVARYSPSNQLADPLISMVKVPSLPWSIHDVKIYYNAANPNDPLNGKIYVAGSEGPGTSGGLENQQAMIWRLNKDGSLDATYGVGGRVVVNGTGTSSDAFRSLAIEPAILTGGIANPNAGKVVAIGYADESTNTSTGVVKYMVRRFNVNGTPDTTFGTNGITQLENFGGKNATGVAIAIQPDGKIVTMGVLDNNPFIDAPEDFPDYGDASSDNFNRNDEGGKTGYDTVVVARLNANGTLDSSFGSSGITKVTDPAKAQAFIGQSMVLQSDGKIVISGTIGTTLQTFRLTSSGSLDATYGNNPLRVGFADLSTVAPGLRTNWFDSVSSVLLPDGKSAVVANYQNQGGAGTYGAGPWVITVIQGGINNPQANTNADDITRENQGETTYKFTVTYTNSVLVDGTSITKDNVKVYDKNGNEFGTITGVETGQFTIVDIAARWQAGEMIGKSVTITDTLTNTKQTQIVTGMAKSNPANAYYDTLVFDNPANIIGIAPGRDVSYNNPVVPFSTGGANAYTALYTNFFYPKDYLTGEQLLIVGGTGFAPASTTARYYTILGQDENTPGFGVYGRILYDATPVVPDNTTKYSFAWHGVGETGTPTADLDTAQNPATITNTAARFDTDMVGGYALLTAGGKSAIVKIIDIKASNAGGPLDSFTFDPTTLPGGFVPGKRPNYKIFDVPDTAAGGALYVRDTQAQWPANMWLNNSASVTATNFLVPPAVTQTNNLLVSEMRKSDPTFATYDTMVFDSSVVNPAPDFPIPANNQAFYVNWSYNFDRYSGTASAGTTTSLTYDLARWSPGMWIGKTVSITGGTGAGQSMVVTGMGQTPAAAAGNYYDILQFAPVAIAPDITSTFAIAIGGTATGGDATSLTDASARWSANEWVGSQFQIRSGPGAGQIITVTGMGQTPAAVIGGYYDKLLFAPVIAAPGLNSAYAFLLPGVGGTGKSAAAANAQSITVVYTLDVTVNPNDGLGWRALDNGEYTIRLLANQVKDVDSVYANARDLTRFQVRIYQPDTTAPTYNFDYYTGTATGGTTTSLVDTTAQWSAGQWIGKKFRITAGTGTGNLLTVTAMGKSVPASAFFDTLIFAAPGTPFTPDATTKYAFSDIYPGITAGGQSSFLFHVYLTDLPGTPGELTSNINVALLASTNLLVTGPANYSQYATFLGVDNPTNGNPRVALYSIPAPSGFWNNTDNGIYHIMMQPNQIADDAASPNYIPAKEIGQFNVAIIPGADVRPTATLANADGTNKLVFDTVVNAANDYAFYIHYRPSVFAPAGTTLDLTTIVNNNLAVQGTSQAPAFNAFAKYDPTFTPLDDGAGGYTVRYTLTNAAGKWTSADNGTYTLTVQPNQIADRDVPANYVPLTQVGKFSMNIQQYATAVVVPPTPLSAIYAVTVSFTNGFVPDNATIGNGDVAVTATIDGLPVSLTPLDTTINPSGTVTYRFVAPNNNWDSRANGAWTVTMVAGTVSGTVSGSPLTLPEIAFGGFNFAYNPPIATLVGVSPVVTGPGNVVVTVQYDGVLAIDQATITNANLLVTRTDGGAPLTLISAIAAPVITQGAGNIITVAYSFLAPGGYWESTDNGAYTVTLQANQVRNTAGQAAAQVVFAPPFFVNIAADGAPPVATLTPIAKVTNAGVTSVVFQVTFTDNAAVDFTSIGPDAIASAADLTVLGPISAQGDASHALPFDAVLVPGSVVPGANGSPITALYRITFAAPLTAGDNGYYSVVVNDNTVRDVSGNAVPTAAIGQFQVQIADTGAPTVDLKFSLTPPKPLSTNFQVTIVYDDQISGIDLTTIGAGNVRVTNTAGDALATADAPAIVVVQSNDRRVEVTYSFAAPGGTWNYLDIGNYSVTAIAGQVRDKSGNGIAQTNLGVFFYSDAPPQAALVGPAITVPLGATTVSFTVEYTDEAALNPALFDANDVLVRYTNNPTVTLVSAGAPQVQQVGASAQVYRVTYTFLAPKGFWTSNDNGTWSIQLLANQVADAGGQFSTGADLGTFNIDLPADTTAPAVILAPNQTVIDPETQQVNLIPPVEMGTTYNVTVIYSDDMAVDVTTIDSTDLIVKRTNGGSVIYLEPSAEPTIVPAANGTPLTVTYHFKAPNLGLKALNQWDYLADGTYTVKVVDGAVADVSGNTIQGTTLGSFQFEDLPPVATSTIEPIVAPSPNNWDFTVTYTDAGGVDLTTISADNISAARTDVGSPLTLISAGAPTVTLLNGNKQVQVVYHFLPPATPNTPAAPIPDDPPTLYWQWLDNGVYTFTLNPNQVFDTGGQPAEGRDLFVVSVNIPQDKILPTAIVTQAQDVFDPGAIQYAFLVNISDNVAVDWNTLIDGADIDLVSPDGTHYPAILRAVVDPTTGPLIQATYRLESDYNFTSADDGLWLIYARPDSMKDVSGNAVAAGTIGSFNVRIPFDTVPSVTVVDIPVPKVLDTTYSVTVVYESEADIDLTTIAGTNLAIGRTAGGTPLNLVPAGNPVIVSLNPTDTKRVQVTYTFTAPGGTWNFPDNGTYTVTTIAGQVADIYNNHVPALTLGTFEFTDVAPTAVTVAPLPDVQPGTQPISIIVQYTAQAPLDAATFDANDLIVRRPANGSQPILTLLSAGAPVVVQADATGNVYRVTYSFLAPNGYWESTSAGTYEIFLAANQVSDVGGAFSLGGKLNQFDVVFDSDTTAPTATLVATDLTAPAATYTFTIRYNDNVAMDYRTIGTGDVLVTGPNGAQYAATLISFVPNTFSATIDAVYRITRTGGFDATVNGSYTVTINGNQVADVSGNFIADDTVAGTFNINCVKSPVIASLKGVGVINQGASYVTITINFTSAYPLEIASLVNNSKVVRVTGPKGFDAYAAYYSIDSAAQGTNRTVTYRLAAPGGSWDFSDNGAYSVSIAPNNGVRNIAGGTLQATSLQGFTVALTSARIQSGVLRVYGTDASDTVELLMLNVADANPGNDQIKVIVNNVQTIFARSLVQSISIETGAGNDTVKINSLVPAVLVRAGSGNDSVFGGDGNDTIFGDAGDDYLAGNDGFDSIRGGDGNDRILGGLKGDKLYGDGGNDSITAGKGNDYVEGGAGNDTIDAGLGSDTVKGDDGDDYIYVRDSMKDVINGGAGTNYAQVDPTLDVWTNVNLLA